MIEVKGSMNYTLLIDNSGEENHGMTYDNSIENDIVSLMVASQALTVQLGQWKEYKKKCTKPQDKKAAGSNIALLAAAIRGVKPLTNALLNTYEDYKKAMTEQSVKALSENQTESK